MFYNKFIIFFRKAFFVLFLLSLSAAVKAQLNTDRVMNIGRNALYFEDYVLAIQYFNQVIKVKPYMAEPYFLRGAAKLSLDDYKGAEEDCDISIEYNPFIIGAYHVRGVARQSRGDYKGAIEDYTKGLSYMPEDKAFLINKAIALAQDKQYEPADSTFTELINYHPSYYNAYISRSQFYMERKDTLRALNDINEAIKIDKYSSYGYAQRSILKFQFENDNAGALQDMDEAIKIDPKIPGYYINRAVIRYYSDDLRGTMEDYNRVVEMEPSNTLAHYNRGLLRMQVGEYNDAINDFSFVLKLDSENFFAVYNRALLYDKIGNFRAAITDYSKVIAHHPDFAEAYYARSEAKRKLGDTAGGKDDYTRAVALADAAKSKKDTDNSDDDDEKVRKESDHNINKFDRLLVADNSEIKSEYESEIRGRVQNKNYKVELEPQFTLTYYEKPSSVNTPHKYIRELDELNRSHMLPYRLYITNREAALDSVRITRHFNSINDNSKLIEINPNNAIPYFARAIDFMLIQDFPGAIEDLSRIASAGDNFIFGYFLRAIVRYKHIEYLLSANAMEKTTDNVTLSHSRDNMLDKNQGSVNDRAIALEYEMVLRDYGKVIEIAPNFPYSYYNRANIRCEQKDFKAALADYTKAIELYPDFAEAYLNRGLVYVYMGENEKSIADLSKAGELGIVSAYNILKRLVD